ncbi:MAG: NAD(+) diphosphatase [Streptosporangiaceae bacterium]
MKVPYAGLGLDRATDRREDPGWVAAQVADGQVRVWPLWRDQCLVAGDPAVPVALPVSAVPVAVPVGEADPGRLVLLGVSDAGPEFALDLSELELEDALANGGADGVADVRALFGGVPAELAGMLAYARGLLYWNRQQRFCGRCGAAAEARHGGHLRVCSDTDCGALIFPRIAPAVIVLVETVSEPRRCLLARHSGSAVGGYSLLAGFVEIGESLEDAVAREILEEVGVVVRDVRYLGSQPFPFPAGLMAGFRATAEDESLAVDGKEILEARWFTRDELRARGQPGRVDAIDRVMLTAWVDEG